MLLLEMEVGAGEREGGISGPAAHRQHKGKGLDLLLGLWTNQGPKPGVDPSPLADVSCTPFSLSHGSGHLDCGTSNFLSMMCLLFLRIIYFKGDVLPPP